MTRRRSAAHQSYAESATSDEDVINVRAKRPRRSLDQASDVSSSDRAKDDDSESEVLSDVLSEHESSIVSNLTASTSSSRQKSSGLGSQARSKNKSPNQVKKSKPAAKATPVADDDQEGSDADTGEVFIPKLPALPAGDVDYARSTIHPNSMAFLADLRENNERSWFQQRDLHYQACKEDFDTFVLYLATRIAEHDPTIPELPVKDLTFRIYRDIRFSNDRTPYKTFLAAYFSRSGRKGPWAGYYISLEPGDKTLLAAGLWQPPAPDLLLVRESIAAEPDRWLKVLQNPDFTQFFGGVDGLLKTNDKLKTCPKGFARDHEQIELLRLKSFNVTMTFKDDEVVDENFATILGAVIQQMEPLVTMLNDIIRPDDLDD